jgi:hypothetical protein
LRAQAPEFPRELGCGPPVTGCGCTGSRPNSGVLEQATKRDVIYTDFLDDTLGREVVAKTPKHLAVHSAVARFPFQKTLESFDFKFQPSIDSKLIRELDPKAVNLDDFIGSILLKRSSTT